jgi:hypothetical protein
VPGCWASGPCTPRPSARSAVPQIIPRWRLEAIQNARDLINARMPADWLEVETQINDIAALSSLLMWKETALTHAAKDTTARNAYCAAHNH